MSNAAETDDDPVLRVKVYADGHHEHMMAPEFTTHAAHSLRNLLKDAANASTGSLRDALMSAYELLGPHDVH